MKKIFFFLALIFSIATSAQDIYSISKPLKLGTVNASTSTADSVLVRGTDKLVKYVPRSEFGGGTQTLQKVLDADNSAIDSNIAVNGPNGRLSLDSNGGELSNGMYGALNINQNGIVLGNRGNSNPIMLQGVNAGVKLIGVNGDYLTMDSSEFTINSNRGLSIRNQSNSPLNLYSTNTLVLDGTAGVEIKTPTASPITIMSPSLIDLQSNNTLNFHTPNASIVFTPNDITATSSRVSLVSSGAPNRLDVSDENSKIKLNSQSGGVEIVSSGGTVVIKNTGMSGIEIGEESSGSNIALKTAGLATLNGVQIATLNDITNYTLPYKVYRALISQDGTNAPTAIVLENTLGGEVVWRRDGVGQYFGDLVGATSVANKTFITTGRTISNFYCVAKAFANSFFIGSVDSDTPGGTDSYLDKMPVEILVYN